MRLSWFVLGGLFWGGWGPCVYADCLELEACRDACDAGDQGACVTQGLLDPNPDTARDTLRALCDNPRVKSDLRARACDAALALRCEIDPKGCLADCDAKTLPACLAVAKYLQTIEGIEPSIPPFKAACALGSALGCDEAALATAHLYSFNSAESKSFAQKAFDLYAQACAAQGGRTCDRALTLAKQFGLQDQRIKEVRAKGCAAGVVFDCEGDP